MQLFGSLPDFNLFSESQHTIEDVMVLAYLYDAIIDLRYIKKPSSPLAMLATKKQLLQASSLYSADLLGILLPFRMSQKELILWIKENWEELKREMSELEPFTPTYIPKNLEFGKIIDEKRKQNISYKEISFQLTQDFPLQKRLWDYNQIRAIHQAFLKYWNQSEESINKLRILTSILKRT